MIESFVYVLCTTLPSHVIAFVQYWDYPWRSKKLAIILESINVLFKMLVVGYALHRQWNVKSVELLISLVGAAIYFYMIQTNRFKLLFSYILIIDYLMVVRGLATFVCFYLFPTDSISWDTSLICILIYLVTMPWMLVFFRRMNNHIRQIDASILWRTIWTIPALTSIVVLLFTNTFDINNAGTWQYLIARLSLLACTLAVCFLLVQALNDIERQAVLEEKDRNNQNILALQRAQYASLQSHMEEIRRARHDLRQHQNIIQAFLDSNDTAHLRSYLTAQQATIPNDSPRSFCRNYAVNLLLNHYAGLYTKEKIDFEFQVQLPEKLKSGESDVCVVIGNLLENALEACIGQQGPYIRAVTRLKGDSGLTIIVDNTAPGPPVTDSDGNLLSTKGDTRGIGTRSIRYIARQYDGKADFQWENGMFMASVFLNL